MLFCRAKHIVKQNGRHKWLVTPDSKLQPLNRHCCTRLENFTDYRRWASYSGEIAWWYFEMIAVPTGQLSCLFFCHMVCLSLCCWSSHKDSDIWRLLQWSHCVFTIRSHTVSHKSAITVWPVQRRRRSRGVQTPTKIWSWGLLWFTPSWNVSQKLCQERLCKLIKRSKSPGLHPGPNWGAYSAHPDIGLWPACFRCPALDL